MCGAWAVPRTHCWALCMETLSSQNLPSTSWSLWKGWVETGLSPHWDYHRSGPLSEPQFPFCEMQVTTTLLLSKSQGNQIPSRRFASTPVLTWIRAHCPKG